MHPGPPRRSPRECTGAKVAAGRVEVRPVVVYYGDIKTGRLGSLERQIAGRFHLLEMMGEKSHEVLGAIGLQQAGVQDPQIALAGCSQPNPLFRCVCVYDLLRGNILSNFFGLLFLLAAA